MRIFLAGAAGVIGRNLVPLLCQAGMEVVGTTRSETKAEILQAQGATPVVVDVFDAAALTQAVVTARPDVVIHQLTDLPQSLDPDRMGPALERNARIRKEATPVLMRAAKAAGARRAIVQSVSFFYADGPLPHREDDPLDTTPARKVTADGLIALEHATLNTPGVEGIVLRYGRLYGPGTWTEVPQGTGPLHVDAAAYAALLAITKGTPGIYNIAEEDGTVSIEKAKRELGFDAAFRRPTGSVC
jgi:nucleoside-diphosphate-sugar epimerase